MLEIYMTKEHYQYNYSPAIVLAGCTIAQPNIPPKPLVANTTGLERGFSATAEALPLFILGTTDIDEAADDDILPK